MPELPEVEMVRRYLERTVLGKPIQKVEVRDDRILHSVSSSELEKAILNQEFGSVRRHGKWLFLELNEDRWLVLHLGMTGDPVFLSQGQEPPDHTRLLISFADGSGLAYSDTRMFGEIALACSPEGFIEVRKIGPDALDLDLPGFLELTRNRRGAIKSLLLNQHLLAGVGNLYADEALFSAGIRPDSHNLDDRRLKMLFAAVQKVLKSSISSQADFHRLPESYLLHYRYPGARCPLDGSLLERTTIAGRTTYYCPKHQRLG
jgi:formamidopyrimidine-DNA glycosylase